MGKRIRYADTAPLTTNAPGVIGDDSVAVVLGDDEDSRRTDRGRLAGVPA